MIEICMKNMIIKLWINLNFYFSEIKDFFKIIIKILTTYRIKEINQKDLYSTDRVFHIQWNHIKTVSIIKYNYLVIFKNFYYKLIFKTLIVESVK